VLYKHGQTTPEEIFANATDTKKWVQFLKIMGVPEDYELSNNKSCWKDKTVIWYISSKLSSEAQRQFIGNTMCIIFYMEADTQPFDYQILKNMGAMLQFCVVVRPHNDHCYRLGCIYRESLKTFECDLPENYLFHDEILKDFILSKVHNGYISSRMYPPINKLYEIPRGNTIREVAQKYSCLHKTTSWKQYISSPRKNIT